MSFLSSFSFKYFSKNSDNSFTIENSRKSFSKNSFGKFAFNSFSNSFWLLLLNNAKGYALLKISKIKFSSSPMLIFFYNIFFLFFLFLFKKKFEFSLLIDS